MQRAVVDPFEAGVESGADFDDSALGVLAEEVQAEL